MKITKSFVIITILSGKATTDSQKIKNLTILVDNIFYIKFLIIPVDFRIVFYMVLIFYKFKKIWKISVKLFKKLYENWPLYLWRI